MYLKGNAFWIVDHPSILFPLGDAVKISLDVGEVQLEEEVGRFRAELGVVSHNDGHDVLVAVNNAQMHKLLLDPSCEAKIWVK